MAAKNTPGTLGIEYEIHIPAYFALILNSNDDVEDFKLRSNVEEFGNLDDLLIDIKTKNREHLYFAFQLKHKENDNKNLLPINFEAKGDFNLEKYCEAFKNLSDENKKYHFVLYTNKNFDPKRKEEVTKFKMELDDCCDGKKFFNTRPDVQNVYQFEISHDTENGKNVTRGDYQLFFSQFTLYAGQINFNDLDKYHILDILKYEEQFLKYVNFFRRWHRGEFSNKIVDKETLNVHLVDIFLAPFVIKNYHLSNGEENLLLFESILRIFDLTIIDDSKANFIDNLFEYEILEYENRTSTHFKKLLQKYIKMYKIDRQQLTDNPKKATEECLLRLGKEIKIVDRYEKELENDTKLKLFYYFFQKPLIVDFNEASKELIYQAMELYKMPGNKIKFVLLGEEIDTKKFHNFKIFENLKDLLKTNEDVYRKIIRRCRFSLQGRSKVSLEEVVGIYEEIADFTGPKEIFQMLKDHFTIGEKKEELPQYYIPRTVSTIAYNVKTILDFCSKTKDIIMINFCGKFEDFKLLTEEKEIKILKVEDYLKHRKYTQNSLMIIDEECSRKQFKEIEKKNKNRCLHHLKIVNESDLMLVMSSQSTLKSKNLQSSKISIEEENILNHFNSPVNIFCASPGMGKSTLLKSLKHKFSSDFWVLRVDLKVHNTFLKEEYKGDKILDYFMQLDGINEEPFIKKLKNVYLNKKKIAILLDGADEIEHVCLNNVLKYTTLLTEMGYRVWLCSRQNLQRKLEASLHTFAIDIEELNEEQQSRYILNKLRHKYKKEELEEIANQIFSSTDIINNQPILGVPLQLHIITEIFLNDRQHQMFLDGNLFVLTKMLRIFFEGRFKHSVCKGWHQNLSKLEDQLQNYEIAALESLFDNDTMNDLDLDLRRNRRFLNTIKEEGDPLGIIVKLNKENKAVFQHFTFGEYFASTFLINNFSRSRILKTQLFSEKYENLFVIFNIMMAEQNQLHLSIIHKDINRIRKLVEGDSNVKTDKSGRNLLHIAMCSATRYPLLQFSPRYVNNKPIKSINDVSVKDFSEESSEFDETLQYLLTLQIDPLEKDRLFEWTPLEYALAHGSLYAAETMLENFGKFLSFQDVAQKYHDDVNIAYYSLRFGFPNLLSAVLADRNFHINEFECLSLTYNKISGSILYFSVMSECNSQKIINVITNHMQHRRIRDILSTVGRRRTDPLTDWYGYTLLHFATEEDNIEAIDLLLRKKFKINSGACNNFHWTPLHLATFKGNTETINLLLSRGANINKQDESGSSPLRIAVCQGHPAVADLLIEKGAKYDRLYLYDAIENGNLQTIEILLRNGLRINKKIRKDQTALHYAIYFGNVDAINLLIKMGADVNVVMENGDTILHFAVKITSKKMLDFLLNECETGHLINAENRNGTTPLHLAVYKGGRELVELLLEKGVDFEKIDANNQQYPLYFAQENGRLQKDLLLRLSNVISEQHKKAKYLNLQAIEMSGIVKAMHPNC